MRKHIAGVSETVAKSLGNTPAVARASYIHPKVITEWAERIGAKGLL